MSRKYPILRLPGATLSETSTGKIRLHISLTDVERQSFMTCGGIFRLGNQPLGKITVVIHARKGDSS